ncbi:MAG: hypothetical protein LBQ10_05290 [Desulfovibrio sp.]|jgi:hypothetical protein|nr:hypothetical protein [Desulfovibrio sp.]
MSRRVILKVYGHIRPVSDELYAVLDKICAGAIADGQDEPVLQRENETARISFEGMYFPVEEILMALAPHLGPEHKGRLDVLDIENWRLTRHVFDGGLRAHSASLNNVLDYAGL